MPPSLGLELAAGKSEVFRVSLGERPAGGTVKAIEVVPQATVSDNKKADGFPSAVRLAGNPTQAPRCGAVRPQGLRSAQAEHHPFGSTLKPGKIEHASVLAVKNWQLAQLLPGLKVLAVTVAALAL